VSPCRARQIIEEQHQRVFGLPRAHADKSPDNQLELLPSFVAKAPGPAAPMMSFSSGRDRPSTVRGAQRLPKCINAKGQLGRPSLSERALKGCAAAWV